MIKRSCVYIFLLFLLTSFISAEFQGVKIGDENEQNITIENPSRIFQGVEIGEDITIFNNITGSVNHSNTTNCWITDEGVKCNTADITSNGMWTLGGDDIYPTNLSKQVGIGMVSSNGDMLAINGTKGDFIVNFSTYEHLKVTGRYWSYVGTDNYIPVISGESASGLYRDILGVPQYIFAISNGLYILGDNGDPTINFYTNETTNFDNTSVIRYDKIDDTINFEGAESVNVVGGTTNFSVDNNGLFVNANTNRVGIGTTNPSTRLEVVGSISSTNFNTTGSVGYNNGLVLIGQGINNLVGNSTTAIGLFAGNGSYGNLNTFIGGYAGANSNGEGNFFLGFASGLDSATNHTICIGYFCAENSKGIRNVGFGSSSLQRNTGSYNAFIGDNAGNSNNGSYTYGLGARAGNNNVGNNSVFLGYKAGENNQDNDVFIVANNTNTLLWGNFSSGRIGINTTTPQNTLNVIGDGNFTNNLSVGGNATILGNLNVSGEAYMDGVYAGAYHPEGNVTTIEFTASNTYIIMNETNANITGSFENGINWNGTGFIFSVAGKYKVIQGMSFTGANADEIHIAVGVNSNESYGYGCHSIRDSGAASAVGNMGMPCLVSVSAGDILYWLVENEQDTDSFSPKGASIVIERVGN